MKAPKQQPDPIPEKLPPVPVEASDPLQMLLNGITSIAERGMDEVAVTCHGVTTRPNEQPLLFTAEGTALRDPKCGVVTDLEMTRVTVTCSHNKQYFFTIGIPTATLLELLERAAVQHPKFAVSLLSQLHSVGGLFKLK